MKLLITGATGLIGKHLMAALTQNDTLTLVGLTRHIDHANRLGFANTQWVDTLDAISFDEIDGIINLAGEPIADKRWSSRQKKIIYDSRVLLTKKIAANVALAQQKPAFVISASAIGYYGRQGDALITEVCHQPHAEFTHTLCSDWETAALAMASENSRVAIVRLGIVLSREGGALKKMLLPFKLGLGGRLGNGKQWMSWIHIDDVVEIIQWIIANPDATGVYNGTAPHPVTNMDFSKSLSSALTRPCLFHQPAILMRSLFGEMADILLFGQKVLPERLLKAGFVFKFSTLPSALRHELAN